MPGISTLLINECKPAQPAGVNFAFRSLMLSSVAASRFDSNCLSIVTSPNRSSAAHWFRYLTSLRSMASMSFATLSVTAARIANSATDNSKRPGKLLIDLTGKRRNLGLLKRRFSRLLKN
jgi:hypothetical protein